MENTEDINKASMEQGDLLAVLEETPVCQCQCCNHDLYAYDANYETADGPTCADCFEQYYFACDHCQGIEHQDSSYSVEIRRPNADGYWRRETVYYCESCYQDDTWTCESCQETFDHNCFSYWVGPDEDTYCEHCYDERFTCCQDCECSIDREDAYYLEDSDDGPYCESCYREQESHSIHNHSYNVVNHTGFFGNPTDDLYYGIELETRVKNHALQSVEAEKTLDILGRDFAVLKYDGSIEGPGFEICSAPATLDIHYDRFKPFFANPPALVSWKYRDCGIHIHVSRKGLSQLKIGKLLVFVNNPDNMDLIRAIAGRYAETWCKVLPKKISDGRKYNCDRYEAINLQNPETIEFRIFRGTMNELHFFADLEFVSALIKFCKSCSMRQLRATGFIEWMKNDCNAKEYKHLRQFMINKNLISGAIAVNNNGETEEGDALCA